MPSIKPSRLANLFTDQFLREGNFELAGAPATEVSQAATTSEWLDEQSAFSNISVQAVGYAENGVGEDFFPAVYLYVTRGAKRALKGLPDEIDGTPVVVESIGKIIVKPRATASNRGHIFDRGGRIACGSSCAPSGKDYSGTLGAFVHKKGDPNGVFAISNNHVIGDCNHLSIGMPIMSPSGNDSRPGNAPRMFAEHAEIIELRSGVPALVHPCRDDLAIGAVPDHNIITSWQGDNTEGYDTPTQVSSPKPGMMVKKFGRTTGLTHGRIQSVVTRTPVRYDSASFRALVWFQQVWTVRSDGGPFAAGGDSGSLVVTEDGTSAVGMIFATNNSGGYVNILSIDRISAAFGGLSLVGNHGV